MYKYKHTCGFEQRFFLNEDVASKIVPCYRCGRNVTAVQDRQPGEVIGEADGIKGVLQREQKPKN